MLLFVQNFDLTDFIESFVSKNTGPVYWTAFQTSDVFKESEMTLR